MLDCALKCSANLWISHVDVPLEETLGPWKEWRAQDADLVITDESVGPVESRPALWLVSWGRLEALIEHVSDPAARAVGLLPH